MENLRISLFVDAISSFLSSLQLRFIIRGFFQNADNKGLPYFIKFDI